MSGKARFDDIYDRPDPRAYFRRLAPLEYEIPHHAQAAFRRAAAATDGGTVLDLCCSYGINAALLNHDVSLSELYRHYTAPGVKDLTTAELVLRDKQFYGARRRADALHVIGLDIAGRALRYAQDVGLLDDAFAENLERDAPSARLREAMAGVGLLTLTGGGSYLTRRTFDALLACARRPVRVSAFVLRTVSYVPVAETLSGYGLRTVADVTRTYPQRLFTDAREEAFAVEAVRALGADPAGREESGRAGPGRFHTVLYESGPPDAWEPVPGGKDS
ncbi:MULTISPECIES: hypothetical protein [Streptomyces]|uniref:Methyltransferase type 12 n=1 Tax=Streptomyces solicathayae TaxID=3081768 RepID=A0ABZ0LL47_9ACTN|nr:hypothetical protein [Streptomyces sp. HUAS YS2]WOX20232.1 hypothetical protein R2D22_02025 [Streptomyces sp. HUAS YS2]